jgi:hypothetical protein
MECIFLQEETKCTANPPRNAIVAWQVDVDTAKDYCGNKDFETCPRFKAYMKYHAQETPVTLRESAYVKT